MRKNIFLLFIFLVMSCHVIADYDRALPQKDMTLNDNSTDDGIEDSCNTCIDSGEKTDITLDGQECTQNSDCPDDYDPCTTTYCNNGICEYPAGNDGASCDDGNACTEPDLCHGGSCQSGSSVVCPMALDECHVVGTCDPQNGCPPETKKADNTPCEDNNACTESSSCQDGVCTGADHVICTALDQCHDVGTCNTSTGVCTDPPKIDGTPCSNGLYCDGDEVCSNGQCKPGDSPCPLLTQRCNEVDDEREYIIQIGTGHYHSCATSSKDGSLYCWGKDTNGQLGIDSPPIVIEKETPVAIDDTNTSLTNDWISISMGYNHSCGVDRKYHAFCWGKNDRGQLGTNQDASILDEARVPTPVRDNSNKEIIDAKKIAAGSYHSCMIAGPQQEVKCWGWASWGRLGNGETSDKISYSSPQSVVVIIGGNSTPLSNVIDIAVGNDHSCAVTNSFKLYCWGKNGKGQLGDGTNGVDEYKEYPVLISTFPLNTSIVAVATGDELSCALSSDGRVFCWGENDFGQLGNSTLTADYYNTPQLVENSGTIFKAKSIGDIWDHVCIVDDKKNAYCWGNNGDGQLGNGTATNSATPSQVVIQTATGDVAIKNVTAISCGQNHTCAIAEQKHYCWGSNDYYQLGIIQPGGKAEESYPQEITTGF